MNSIAIDDYISQSLTDYGRGINTERQIVSAYDGLKPVYRRVIYTALKCATNMTKTAAITGQVLATVHPHGSDSVDSVISSLVRWGVFEGQGNHGIKLIYGDDIGPSASRYTEARIDPKWRNIFSKLMDYVPYSEAELPGNVEPDFLPTPLPMILLFSGLGIAYGINGRYPMFEPKSMLEAMVKDDPSLLKAPFGLTIDHSKSELNDLWTKGLGRITYKYDCQAINISAGKGVMISGSAEIFKPNLEKGFEEELESGRVFILDQTDSSIPKVFVGISKGVRAITIDDVLNTCQYLCTYTRMYRLTVTDGTQAYVMPLKDWLHECYVNYLDIVDKYKDDQISKLEFDYRVYDWLPIVANMLLKDRDLTDEDILSRINNSDCDLEVIKAITRKTIGTLRNTDSTAKLSAIRSQIKEFQKLDPATYTIDMINAF